MSPVASSTSTRVTLRFHVAGSAATRKLPHHARWGYRCHVHGYEPSLTTMLPLLADCQRSLASLGGKYAAILLPGEPLSPEERAHADELEKLPIPSAEGEGPEAAQQTRALLQLSKAIGSSVLQCVNLQHEEAVREMPDFGDAMCSSVHCLPEPSLHCSVSPR